MKRINDYINERGNAPEFRKHSMSKDDIIQAVYSIFNSNNISISRNDIPEIVDELNNIIVKLKGGHITKQ